MLKILRWKKPTSLLLFVVPIFALNAGATELYNNLSATVNGLQFVYGPSPIIPFMVGDSFSTDGNASQLMAVTLSFQGTFNGQAGFGSDPLGSNNLYLYNSTTGAHPVPDTSTTPVLLGTLADANVPGSPGAPALYTFVPSTTVGLSANTRYWIALGGTSTPLGTCVVPTGSGDLCVDANWSFGGGPGLGVAGEYHGDNLVSGSTSLNWITNTFPNGVGELPYLMNVQVQETPEPSTFVLGATGLAGLLVGIRRNAGRR